MSRLPMVGLETDIHDIIERYVDIAGYCSDCDNVELYGTEAAAIAIVDELRKHGLVS